MSFIALHLTGFQRRTDLLIWAFENIKIFYYYYYTHLHIKTNSSNLYYVANDFTCDFHTQYKPIVRMIKYGNIILFKKNSISQTCSREDCVAPVHKKCWPTMYTKLELNLL